MAPEPAIVISGPRTHRTVSANGTRFHVASIGDGPLVLLLHGFPEFWWTWRTQLVTLAAAGYRAVAADLRGYGGSDKPPRGYDLVTAAAPIWGSRTRASTRPARCGSPGRCRARRRQA